MWLSLTPDLRGPAGSVSSVIQPFSRCEFRQKSNQFPAEDITVSVSAEKTKAVTDVAQGGVLCTTITWSLRRVIVRKRCCAKRVSGAPRARSSQPDGTSRLDLYCVACCGFPGAEKSIGSALRRSKGPILVTPLPVPNAVSVRRRDHVTHSEIPGM